MRSRNAQSNYAKSCRDRNCRDWEMTGIDSYRPPSNKCQHMMTDRVVDPQNESATAIGFPLAIKM